MKILFILVEETYCKLTIRLQPIIFLQIVLPCWQGHLDTPQGHPPQEPCWTWPGRIWSPLKHGMLKVYLKHVLTFVLGFIKEGFYEFCSYSSFIQ